jgi:CheY-like chemotaxis protein
MTFERSEFRLPSLISSITDLLNSKAEEKNLKLITSYDANIPEVLVGDAVRLNQIILNLVSNAVKFTEKGEIRLSVKLSEMSSRYVKLNFSVKDTGIGIPEEIMPFIFESFTQASTEITRKYGGTGLGLNIVKELVERQGGKISVKSTPGEGSEFSVAMKFRVSTNQQRINGKTEPVIMREIDKDVKILLVEDNVINQLVAQSVLNEFGFHTDVADNGKQALQKLKTGNYDLVLMDIQMPEMSGYDVTRYIRSKFPKPLSQIPIIAMTANAGKTDAEKCLKAGMDDYISKPFDENNLYSKICSCVEKQVSLRKRAEAVQLNEAEKWTDLNYLRDMSGGNSTFMAEIISLFMSQTPAAISSMKKHLDTGNYEGVAQEAHKIRPSFNFMGIKGLEEIAGRIEESGRSGNNISHIPDSIRMIENVCNSAYSELTEELKKLT